MTHFYLRRKKEAEELHVKREFLFEIKFVFVKNIIFLQTDLEDANLGKSAQILVLLPQNFPPKIVDFRVNILT